MSYRVIQRFVDLQDNKHRYEVGDEYPRLNVNVSQKRIDELASDKNRRGIPLIAKETETEVVGEAENTSNNFDFMNVPEIKETEEVVDEKFKKKSKGKKKEDKDAIDD